MDVDWKYLLDLAVQQGLWTVLCIYLFFRMLPENTARESKYQKMIIYFNDNIGTVIDRIQVQLEQIHTHVVGNQ